MVWGPLRGMLAIFLKTLPFFAVIGLGFLAGRAKFFTAEATSYLTKFVFYFALSAMLFDFAAHLDLGSLFDWHFVLAYLLASSVVWLLVAGVACWRGVDPLEAAVEAHCAVMGNLGFLGIPMLTLVMGSGAVGPVLMIVAIDMIVFSSVLTLLITGLRERRMSAATFGILGWGLLKNPMIVSVVLGLAWGATGVAVPAPLGEFLTILAAAAAPCALFAIGASLSVERLEQAGVAAWLSFAKLVLHPAAVALAALKVFSVEPFAASVMIAASAFPVAGNVFILAQHYGVAPQRVSAAILISTAVAVLTVTGVVALLVS